MVSFSLLLLPPLHEIPILFWKKEKKGEEGPMGENLFDTGKVGVAK